MGSDERSVGSETVDFDFNFQLPDINRLWTMNGYPFERVIESMAVEEELAALLEDLRRSRQPIENYLRSSSNATLPRSEAALRALANSALFENPIKSRCDALTHLLSLRTKELEKEEREEHGEST